MAAVVKTSLSYRQEQAVQTRHRIAGAARTLFATGGYGATSMALIAQEAGVAPRTVYSVFGTKREILSAICEQWLEDARARERAAEVLAEPDPHLRLRAAAGWLTNLYAAGFDVVRVLDAAMDEDAETQTLLRAKLAGRNQVMDAMIASVEAVLRAPVEDVQAVFRALAATGVYRELVEDSGWTLERFTGWVGDCLAVQLVGARGQG